jgi:hypothetical protein
VCDRCLDDLSVDHASVALATGDGLWAPAFATSAIAADLDQTAFTLGEGPCYDAMRRQAPLLVADLMDYSRQRQWPLWVPAARAVGVRAVSALPIQAGAIVAGVLTLLSEQAGALSGAQLTRALRLADTALLGLLDLISGLQPGAEAGSNTPAADASLSRHLADLVRADVHQAAGMIMVQAGVPIDQALARLRAHAFGADRSLREIATDVLARRLTFTPERDSAE